MFQRDGQQQEFKRKWIVLCLLMVLAVVSVVLTALCGTPDELPVIALEFPALLYAERAVALFAIGLAVISVFNQGWKGRLPTQISSQGVVFEEAEAARVAKKSLDELIAADEKLSNNVEKIFHILAEIHPKSVKVEDGIGTYPQVEFK